MPQYRIQNGPNRPGSAWHVAKNAFNTVAPYVTAGNYKRVRDLYDAVMESAPKRPKNNHQSSKPKPLLKTVSVRRRIGSGRAAGKVLKTPKRFKRPKKSSPAQGYVHNHESAGQVQCAGIGYIGHITFPVIYTRQVIFGALIKRLLESAGMKNFTSTIDLITSLGGAVGDTVTLSYSLTPTTARTTYTFTIGAADTLAALAYYFSDSARAYLSETGLNDQVRFYEIRYVPVNSYTTLRPTVIDLELCRVSLSSKSNLKVQNRTVFTAGEDEMDVNNQPIYGKGYFGTGSGAEMVGDVGSTNFYAHGLTGVIGGDDLTVPLLESVPAPELFKGVKKTGKWYCNPGDIKTSQLKSRSSMLFTDAVLKLVPQGAGANSNIRKKMGHFRFFVFDKMIFTAMAGDPAYNMVLAFENQWQVAAQVSVRQAKLTNIADFGTSRGLSF